MQLRSAAFALCVVLSACSEQPPATDNTLEIAKPKAGLEQAKPSQNYDFKEGEIYGYIAAVSDEEKKTGKAAGDVLTFKYLGDANGITRLKSLSPNGSEVANYECATPCVAIKVLRGGEVVDRIAYTPDSVIGSVFEDAMNGHLAAARDKLRAAAPAAASWQGEYKGTFEGEANGVVGIKETGSTLAVSIGIGAPSCAGGIEFKAPKPSGSTLVHRMPEDEGGNQCSIKITRDGRRLTVAEDECFYHHGAQCSFNGEASR